jgi:1-pyrroline-2-carboxylate reductase [NAD(P)H]
VKVISADQVHEALKYPDFVNILKEAYAGSYTMPQRKVFLLEEGSHDAFALLPSWNDNVIGVKSFTYFPQNEDPYKSLYSKILLCCLALFIRPLPPISLPPPPPGVRISA